MALDKNIIVNGIKNLQASNPKNTADAAKGWSKFLYDYATGGMAGVCVPTFPSQPATLEKALKGIMDSKTFLVLLGTNLAVMWMAAVWAGPSFTGVTAAAVGPSLDGVLAAIPPNAPEPEKKIADAIHNWTKTITVTLTNTASGATSVAPVS